MLGTMTNQFFFIFVKTPDFNHLSLKLLENFFQMFKVQKEYLLETMKLVSRFFPFSQNLRSKLSSSNFSYFGKYFTYRRTLLNIANFCCFKVIFFKRYKFFTWYNITSCFFKIIFF